MLLALLPLKIWSTEILQRFTVRIHSQIVEKGRSWARLWYLLRGLDRRGSGFVTLPVVTITELLGASSSTIYQWLREGKAIGAFRKWKCQRGNLRVAIGGLFSVCQALGLNPDISDLELSSRKKFNVNKGLPALYRCKAGFAPWGVTASIPLFHLSSLQTFRAAATAATTQRLQQLSRFAAWKNLSPEKRKQIRLPQPERFFPTSGKQQGGFSDDSASGNLPPCCIHIGKKRAWVSKGFIPFGTSQTAIAQERGISARTVRRHLDLLQIERRQIVQSRSEYRLAAECLAHDGGATKPSNQVQLYSSPDGEYYLLEWHQDNDLEGHYTKTTVGQVGFNRIHSRFFSYGSSGSNPKIWLYRCNLYRPSLDLHTMSASRATYRRLCKSADVLQAIQRVVDVTSCKRGINSLEILDGVNALHAEKDGQNP